MSTKRHAPIPRVTSKTITVRSLLKKIQRLILDEPKRLNMDTWITVFAGRKPNQDAPVAGIPACGTVACMAGWGAVLLRPDGASAQVLGDKAEYVFTDLLGYDSAWGERLVSGLFSPDYTGYDESPEDGGCYLPMTGTQEHAEVIATRIDTYMRAHPEILTRKIDVAAARKALRA